MVDRFWWKGKAKGTPKGYHCHFLRNPRISELPILVNFQKGKNTTGDGFVIFQTPGPGPRFFELHLVGIGSVWLNIWIPLNLSRCQACISGIHLSKQETYASAPQM